jgi:hypothetical protein
MANEIKSVELWDRLALILGTDSDLGDRPAGNPPETFALEKPFDADWLGDEFKGDAVLNRVISDVRACARHLAFAKPTDKSAPPSSEGIVATYVASFEHSLDGRYARTTEVRYTAKDPYDAIGSAIKFWLSRQRHLPEVFQSLYAVKVWHDALGPIAADGSKLNGSSFPLFEWKYDSYPGAPLETSALVRIAEMIRSNAKRNTKGMR